MPRVRLVIEPEGVVAGRRVDHLAARREGPTAEARCGALGRQRQLPTPHRRRLCRRCRRSR